MKAIDFSYFIERYNSGEMDTLEKKWFQKELEGNTVLQKEVEFRKRVDDCLIQHDLIDLRKKLTSLEKTRKEKVASNEGKKAVVVRFAASMAVLVLIGVMYYFISRGSVSADKLYDKSFSPYHYAVVQRSAAATDLNIDLSFNAALDLYNNGDYRTAASALKEYLILNPEKTDALFILGVSEMGNNNFDSAIKILSDLCENKSNLFLDHSQWYLSLCYLKTENYSAARKELQAIISSGNYYNAKARKVLKKIK